jgi:hypothetical protein
MYDCTIRFNRNICDKGKPLFFKLGTKMATDLLRTFMMKMVSSPSMKLNKTYHVPKTTYANISY